MRVELEIIIFKSSTYNSTNQPKLCLVYNFFIRKYLICGILKSTQRIQKIYIITNETSKTVIKTFKCFKFFLSGDFDFVEKSL